jgi:hypothetical protein
MTNNHGEQFWHSRRLSELGNRRDRQRWSCGRSKQQQRGLLPNWRCNIRPRQGRPAKAKGFVVSQRLRRGSICRNGSAQESANGNNLVQAFGGATGKISLLSEPGPDLSTSPPPPEVGTNFTPTFDHAPLTSLGVGQLVTFPPPVTESVMSPLTAERL